jgi:DNA gyrase subunit B
MDATQLWETTMNPENRVLIQVRVQDAERADAIFNKLMGDEVLLRKNFIQAGAAKLDLEELDI